ncbi:Imm26 family immunity protein [Thalassolituus sp.]
MSRTIVKPGDVYSVPLEDGRYSYAQALESPEFAFFDVATETELTAEEAISHPLMFRIWVHKSSLKTWNKLGKVPISEQLSKQVPRFKQNALNGKLSIYINGQETPASLDEVRGLECAAVWEGSHILSRIRDHLAGQENLWVSSMQPKQKG